MVRGIIRKPALFKCYALLFSATGSIGAWACIKEGQEEGNIAKHAVTERDPTQCNALRWEDDYAFSVAAVACSVEASS